MPDTKTKTTDDKVIKSEEQWRNELSPMQYAVLREKATERPFSGEYEHDHRAGTYT
jgi:peptide-methionine (R)-S-oxide reductase